MSQNRNIMHQTHSGSTRMTALDGGIGVYSGTV
jgi:hypothetical protein